jgi:hypothetical protein
MLVVGDTFDGAMDSERFLLFLRAGRVSHLRPGSGSEGQPASSRSPKIHALIESAGTDTPQSLA